MTHQIYANQEFENCVDVIPFQAFVFSNREGMKDTVLCLQNIRSFAWSSSKNKFKNLFQVIIVN